MKQVVEKRKDIVFYIKLFPLPMHKNAYGRAKAIACGNFALGLLDEAFEKKPLPEASCETTAIDDNIKLGKSLGINGTPALIFPNGQLVSGAIDADAIIRNAENQ
jgi:thiol:disulfide interchange protein DsbC